MLNLEGFCELWGATSGCWGPSGLWGHLHAVTIPRGVQQGWEFGRDGAWSLEQEPLKEERSLFVDQSPASLGSGRNTLYKLPREMAPLGTQVAVLGDEPPGVWALVMLDKGAVSA